MGGHWSSKQTSLFVTCLYSKYGQETCILSDLQEQNSMTAYTCLKMTVDHWARKYGVSIPAAAVCMLPDHASLGPSTASGPSTAAPFDSSPATAPLQSIHSSSTAQPANPAAAMPQQQLQQVVCWSDGCAGYSRAALLSSCIDSWHASWAVP
eukprot:1143186-Pelagomonas_calceolata.AAC.4